VKREDAAHVVFERFFLLLRIDTHIHIHTPASLPTHIYADTHTLHNTHPHTRTHAPHLEARSAAAPTDTPPTTQRRAPGSGEPSSIPCFLGERSSSSLMEREKERKREREPETMIQRERERERVNHRERNTQRESILHSLSQRDPPPAEPRDPKKKNQPTHPFFIAPRAPAAETEMWGGRRCTPFTRSPVIKPQRVKARPSSFFLSYFFAGFFSGLRGDERSEMTKGAAARQCIG
jgi:hypothetical protein